MQNHEMSNQTGFGKSSNRRRKYLINPAFQWKYAITITVMVLLMSTLISSVLYGVLHHQARERLVHPLTYSSNVSLVIFLTGLAFTLLTAGAIGAWFIVVTHRVCGPIFVMERYLKQLKEGRLPSLRPFRKKDEFKEFFTTFEGAIDSLKASKETDRDTLTNVLAMLQTATHEDEAARGDTLQKASIRLQGMLDQTRRALGRPDEESSIEPSTESLVVDDAPIGTT